MWDIASQTKIKLAILRNYLAAWATVLKSRERVLYYVDGFAGPGWYNDPQTGKKVPGSPVLAIQLYLDQKRNRGWDYELRLINVEKEKVYFQELLKETSQFAKDMEIDNIPGEFLDNLADILVRIGNHHTFFFIDPFGISGIEFAEIEAVLSRGKTEILLNFNYDGLQRCLGELTNLDHPDPKRKAKATSTIDRVCRMLDLRLEDLKKIMSASSVPKEKKVLLLRRYRENLPNYKSFAYPLSINYPYQERTFYYLIFMTDNPVALAIMKDVMKKAKKMENGEQMFLPLPQVDVRGLKKNLFNRYAGKTIDLRQAYSDWLMNVLILDGRDYLAGDLRRALNDMAKDEDMPVTKIPGKVSWNPIYKFGNK